MTTYFITRHQGAVTWAEQQGFTITMLFLTLKPTLCKQATEY